MIYRSERGNIRMLLAGDAMPARALHVYDEPDYLALVELCRGADVGFANLETTVREPHEGTPTMTQGTPMATPPALLEELRWMGLGLLSCANNHATDYGEGGLLAMLAHLRRANIPHAGAGANLAEARKPAYLDTAAGRVALIAATTFYPHWTRAADQRPDAGGRPGVNPLDFASLYTVDDAALAALAAIERETRLVAATPAPTRDVLQRQRGPHRQRRRIELSRTPLRARAGIRRVRRRSGRKTPRPICAGSARRAARPIG